jgi:hypothetical protein
VIEQSAGTSVPCLPYWRNHATYGCLTLIVSLALAIPAAPWMPDPGLFSMPSRKMTMPSAFTGCAGPLGRLDGIGRDQQPIQHLHQVVAVISRFGHQTAPDDHGGLRSWSRRTGAPPRRPQPAGREPAVVQWCRSMLAPHGIEPFIPTVPVGELPGDPNRRPPPQ